MCCLLGSPRACSVAASLTLQRRLTAPAANSAAAAAAGDSPSQQRAESNNANAVVWHARTTAALLELTSSRCSQSEVDDASSPLGLRSSKQRAHMTNNSAVRLVSRELRSTLAYSVCSLLLLSALNPTATHHRTTFCLHRSSCDGQLVGSG